MITELDPPKATGRRRQDPARCSTPSSFVCAPDASGTGCRSTLVMTAPSIARFRGGSPLGYSPGSGPSSSLAVMSWAVWTGSGSRQMRRWVKLVWGGCNWPQPDRPRQAGDQAQYPRRGQRWATEHRGGPANVHDTKLLEVTLRSVVVERPRPSEDRPQHLCLDKGYDNPTGHQTVSENDYQPHIRRIGEEKLDASGQKRYPARRWVSNER